MHCFICVTYMIILGSCHPGRDRDLLPKQEERSLFRDVIESLRIRSQLPEDQNEENNLAQNYERYEDEPPHLPSDADFIPRRNDRIEMPPMKYRFPKSIENNETFTDAAEEDKQEILVYIDTNKEPKVSTQKPLKKQKRPVINKNKGTNKKKDNEEETDGGDSSQTDNPLSNTMSGQSHIGNRETQMVIKPTVIVNFRGTVKHTDSDIKLESRKNDSEPRTDGLRNIFNIKQEVRFDKLVGGMGSHGGIKSMKPQSESDTDNDATQLEPISICGNSNMNSENNTREGRNYDNTVQILFSIE